MHVIVIGAGVIGTTTAWYLRQAGHTVEVIEQAHSPAQGTSYANAGQLSYSYAMPWAAPGVPLKAMKWLLDADAPFKIRPDTREPLRQMAWLARMFAQCTPQAFERNKTAMLHLAAYSRQAMHELLAMRPQLAFDYQRKGTLQVFRTQQQMQSAANDVRILQNAGVRCSLLTHPDTLLELEPGLAGSRVPLAGALHLPDDETGDCLQFTEQLAKDAREAGVTFHYGTRALFISVAAGGVRVVTEPGPSLLCDAVVLCTGSHAHELLGYLGVPVRSSLYPVKGYSLTFALQDEAKGPVSTLMDETYKVAITRLGSRVRVGGTAELCGYDRTLRPSRRHTLERAVADLFPQAGALEQAQFWTGLRPTTPTGVPNIGPVLESPVRNVWVNFGHGTLGWTMACGSAQALALMMSGREAQLPEPVRAAIAASPMGL